MSHKSADKFKNETKIGRGSGLFKSMESITGELYDTIYYELMKCVKHAFYKRDRNYIIDDLFAVIYR